MSKEYQTLSGGYLNLVYKKDDIVYVRLKERPTISDPIEDRFKTYVSFLENFGGDVAPKLIGSNINRHRIAMSNLEGSNLKDIISHLDKNKDKCVIESAYKQIGEAIKKVHSNEHPNRISPYEYSKIYESQVLSDLETFKSFHDSLPSKVIDVNLAEEVIYDHIIPSIHNIINSYNMIGWNHADFWTSNAIAELKDGNLNFKGLIDAEFSKPGVPEEDLSQMFMWELDNCPEFIPAFECGYGLIDSKKLKPFYIANCLNYLRPITRSEYLEEEKQEDISEAFFHKHIKILENNIESTYANAISSRVI